MALTIPAIRRQFPLLAREDLTYLDTAATAQKPQAVLDAMREFYERSYANPHRGMHILAEEATVAFEDARKSVQRFLNAEHLEEIVFTKNCTEAINLVARSWGSQLKKKDAIAVSLLEHHSNIVPWFQCREQTGAQVAWIEIDDEGHILLDSLDRLLAKGDVKLVAITALSNVLGVRPPLEEIICRAHAAGALVLLDAAQAAGHGPIDVQKLDCDFLAFSGHKIYGPTGIGVLYAKREILEAMPPFLGGGKMIREVREDGFSPADIPLRFEAGTQPVAEAIGLRAAIEWGEQFTWKDRIAHERELLKRATSVLSGIDGVSLLGPRSVDERSSCISFTVEGIHPHDLTDILGRKGICMRAGHHCTQPLHRRLGIIASTRLSVGIYNTLEEIDRVGPAITDARARFA
ncbi:MAG: SufS family cysteine desulfurase [Candidatus Peregrinibacteria bacterium]|nr:SufS family cysteine desulfurase [Candidatus Peregrinibacteria bacterium]